MDLIHVRNVQTALPEALYQLELKGVDRPSRNGEVRLFPGPVTTLYNKPTERVMFWADRDCNPFFHLFESLWMLAGRNDVAFLDQFNSNMKNYSDDGKTFHGAYGHRWRNHFGEDQLKIIINLLKENPQDRRCVLQMWDMDSDLGLEGKDFPCNTLTYFSINNEDTLDMTVLNRSNDIVWGAYGANAVHFSILQEYMATMIGVGVGRYWQVSNNFHVYKNKLGSIAELSDNVPDASGKSTWDPYVLGFVKPFPLVSTDKKIWDYDLQTFMASIDCKSNGINPDSCTDPFFKHVALPMYKAWRQWKTLKGEEKFVTPMFTIGTEVRATDWQRACGDWINRRYVKWRRAQDDGVDHGNGLGDTSN